MGITQLNWENKKIKNITTTFPFITINERLLLVYGLIANVGSLKVNKKVFFEFIII